MAVQDQYAYLRPQRGVWVFILGSAAVHAGLVAVLVLGGILRESRAGSRDRARITALLKLGKERPKDWLPRKAPAPAPAAPKETRPDPKAQPKDSPTSAPSRQDYSKDMAKALRGLGTGNGKSEDEQEGSPDGVAEGTALIAQKGSEYMTKVYTAVKAQYSVPEIISLRERMFLSATVVITLNAQGRIKGLTFEKRSGNAVFDSAIEAAVRRAAPFPPPPPELADRYATEGIGLDFDARSM